MGLIDVRFPRRVDAQGNTVEEYHPISMSIDLNIIPLSTATMQLPWDEKVPARSYVELFTPLGSAGFFRVRSPEDAYGEDITSVELEHAITEVGDYLVKAEYDQMMAASTAMQTVFGYYGGGRWQLGSVAALGNGEIALSAKYDRVLDVMLSILEQKPDCYLAFNFSTTPWTVSVAVKDSVVSAEGRLSRNIDSARVIYDDTELCTRVYYEHETTTSDASGIDPTSVPTFDVNVGYSAGAKVLYNGRLYSLPSGHASGETWANTVSVLQTDIPSTAWAHLDADTLGRYGLIERQISTGSKYTQAEALKVAQEYLRTHKEPRVTVRVQAEELSSATGEAWDTFTIAKLLRLALVDYDVTVERNITGQSWNDVIGKPEAMEIILGEEEDTAIKFIHDVDSKGGSGGGGGGKKKEDDKWKEYRTLYERDDYHFSLVAERLKSAVEVIERAGLRIDSSGVLIYAADTQQNLKSQINVRATEISQQITANGTTKAALLLKLNDGEARATLKADVIDIDGLVLKLAAKTIGVGALSVEGAAEFLSTVYGEATITAEGAIRSNTGFNVGGTNLNVADASVSNGVLTIEKVDGTSLTFSRAISSDTWSWVNGHASVTLQPQNQTFTSPNITDYSVSGDKTWTSDFAFTQKINVQDEDGATVAQLTLNMSIADKYEQATVTPQGTAHGEITPIGTEHKFSYDHLYKAGSSATYYKGNGTTVTGRGSSVPVTPIGTEHKLKYTRLYTAPDSSGTVQWAYVSDSSGSTKWYSAGTATNYYKGDGPQVTGRGDSVSVTEQGDTQWAYVANSSGTTKFYSAGTKITGLRNPGTEDSTTYFKKKATQSS